MSQIIEIEDPQGVISALQARIEQLEGQAERDRQWHADSLPGAVRDTLKHLRAHGVILLYLGSDDPAEVRNRVSNYPASREALDQAWPLATAPVANEVKDALRTAANNGMDRWS
jgi:hypothetical protein